MLYRYCDLRSLLLCSDKIRTFVTWLITLLYLIFTWFFKVYIKMWQDSKQPIELPKAEPLLIFLFLLHYFNIPVPPVTLPQFYRTISYIFTFKKRGLLLTLSPWSNVSNVVMQQQNQWIFKLTIIVVVTVNLEIQWF